MPQSANGKIGKTTFSNNIINNQIGPRRISQGTGYGAQPCWISKNLLFSRTEKLERNKNFCGSKISSDQKRLFFTVSLYPFSFFANTPIKEECPYFHTKGGREAF